MNPIFLMLVVCPLLGAAVFASVVGLGFGVALLLRLSLRWSRALGPTASNG